MQCIVTEQQQEESRIIGVRIVSDKQFCGIENINQRLSQYVLALQFASLENDQVKLINECNIIHKFSFKSLHLLDDQCNV